jgi:hypothetical protein
VCQTWRACLCLCGRRAGSPPQSAHVPTPGTACQAAAAAAAVFGVCGFTSSRHHT